MRFQIKNNLPIPAIPGMGHRTRAKLLTLKQASQVTGWPADMLPGLHQLMVAASKDALAAGIPLAMQVPLHIEPELILIGSR